MRKLVPLSAAIVLTGATLSAVGVAQGADTGSTDTSAKASVSVDKPLWREARDYYSTLRAPQVLPQGEKESFDKRSKAPTWWDEEQRRHTLGFPPAAKELARRESVSETKGVSPMRSMEKSGADPVTHAKLLTLLVEFNPEANDDFSGWERPDDPSDPTGCVTEPAGTLLSGPVHNQLPDPATLGIRS